MYLTLFHQRSHISEMNEGLTPMTATSSLSRRWRAVHDLFQVVAPSYAVPAAISYAGGVLTRDASLGAAAFTIIAVPSAAAAAMVTVVGWVVERKWADHWNVTAVSAVAVGLVGSAVVAASLCAAAVVGMAEAGMGLLDIDILRYAPLSAALGGAVAGGAWALGRRGGDRRASPPPGGHPA